MSNSNEIVYERIREAIIYGDIAPGSALGEVELSERYQISRTPVREALKRLAGEGLLTRRKRGLAVKSYTRREVSEVYDLRALLESYAAALAAGSAMSDHVAQLRNANLRYESAVRNVIARLGDAGHAQRVRSVIEENTRFHDAVLATAGHSQLDFLVSRVMVLPLVFRSFFWGDEHDLLMSCRAHDVLITAIEEGDSDRARSAMSEHIYVGRDHVLRHLTDAGNLWLDSGTSA